MENNLCSLASLRIGEVGELVKFEKEDKAFRRRMLDMGLTKGVKILVKQISPLGDPISVLLRGYQLCLRKEDVTNILVRKEVSKWLNLVL